MDIQSLHGYQADRKSDQPESVSDSSSAVIKENSNERCIQFGLDLELPHPDTYLPETVDFPSSPSVMMKYRMGEHQQDEDHRSNHDYGLDLEGDQSFHAVIDHNSVRLRKDDEEWCDSANVSDTEEYFEDFHLPLTHQNSMSTRRSFMRKIKSVEIRMPDADRIEGIVKSGQLDRHGSIRRKIVPQPQDFIISNDSLGESGVFKLTSSTPNNTFTNVAPTDESIIIGNNPEMAPLDDETLSKIKDCLDAGKVKDIYTLGSRLQDLLTPVEVEEIISNSHRYGDVISRDVVLALSNQINSKTTAKPDLIDRFGGQQQQQTQQQAKVKKRISIMDDIIRTSLDDSDAEEDSAAHPSTLRRHQQVIVEEIAQVETPSKSESLLPTPSDGWDISPDGLNSNDGLENSIAERMPKPDLIPEISAQEERDEERNWRSVVISGLERKIDLKVIEPYKKVLSHGGYQNNDCQTAVIVFSACFLPDRSRVDYDYVMEHLFLYVLTTLDQLVAEDYVLIYFHGATPKNCIPRFSWVKNCYQMIDRRLRKNLKRLYLVHPTLWLKAAVLMCRPFISAKFSRKIMYVPNLPSLSTLLPMDHVCIPDRVKQYDLLKESLSNG